MISRFIQKSAVRLYRFINKEKDTRARFIDSITKNGEILEIGPFFNPICKGKNVKYFDILSYEELVARAQALTTKKKINNIPHIDYVSPKGDLTIIDRKFDAVISSHVIEHQLDFINHLNTVSGLLKEGGKYYLMIPDKRYCFDHFNRESTIAEIIDASTQKRERHSLKSVIEHQASTTHNDAFRHWKGDHGSIDGSPEKIQEAIREYNTGAYIDVHAWYFTPATFVKIMKTLNELDMVDLAISEIHTTPYLNLEFYAVLEKNGVK